MKMNLWQEERRCNGSERKEGGIERCNEWVEQQYRMAAGNNCEGRKGGRACVKQEKLGRERVTGVFSKGKGIFH